ncbi:hypothetical protein FRX31_013276, partial [Thalictrum thalictroides]
MEQMENEHRELVAENQRLRDQETQRDQNQPHQLDNPRINHEDIPLNNQRRNGVGVIWENDVGESQNSCIR